MSEKTQRLIKKYPNRRLYDTEVSRYITLHDIRQLVIDCIEFQVVDAKSGEDLTNNTLLQIILDQEDTQSPIFTRDILQNVIRSYGDSMQNMMSSYLEKSMQFYIEQSGKVKQGMSAMLENSPMKIMTDLAENNMRLWQSMQEQFMNQATKSSPSVDKEPDNAQPEQKSTKE